MSEPVKKVLIVGGGTAGWMTAASLANFFNGKEIRIELVESTEIGTVGVGEATIPGIQMFNRSLGISEFDFMRSTHATFKLGIQFRDWRGPSTDFFHPFAAFGYPYQGLHFHHYWLRAKLLGEHSALEDYCLPVAMAKQNKFSQPQQNPQSPLAKFNYAYHFDAVLFAKYLRAYAERLGVIRHDSKVTGVNLRSDDGYIESVMGVDGARYEADLFIDCSGFKGLLIEESLATGYENWSHWLPCDSAVAVQSESVEEPVPYTRATARAAGWQWQIPLQHRMGNGYVYSSSYLGDDEAASVLLASINGSPLTAPKRLKFTPGMRKKFWNKNCVAIGLAGGFLEPLESTSIAVIQTAISRLLMLFPDKSFNPALITEANRLARLEMERLRDFIILHYKGNGRDDAELWRMTRAMAVPESLQLKMDLYRDRGHLINYEQESFMDESWLAIYSGLGVIPANYDHRVDHMNNAELLAWLKKIRETVATGAGFAETHADFIRHNLSKSQ